MDFRAIVDLVKYTLALSAACFAYTLDKLVPAPSEGERWFVLGILVAFVVSALAGILIFSSATAALNGDDARKERQRKLIEPVAWIHLACLGLGVLLLGGKLVEKVLTEVPAAPCATPCCPVCQHPT